MELLHRARELYKAGDMHDALEVAQVACERKPRDAEAWWLLGCISRHNQMPAASDDAFRRAAQLSRRHPSPVRLDSASFRRVVDTALEALSGDARRRLSGTQVLVESLPDGVAVKSGASPDALALRRREPEDVLTLYQVNLENRSGGLDELSKLVGRTLARA
ncbi:MAG: hypothetical protein M3Z13_08220 [Candidatus Dormibacteraeota bacterium]|nr:hypothetical protein [Candidatus Dormibacteraeota bacterium]